MQCQEDWRRFSYVLSPVFLSLSIPFFQLLSEALKNVLSGSTVGVEQTDFCQDKLIALSFLKWCSVSGIPITELPFLLADPGCH